MASKTKDYTERTAHKDRPTLPPSSILRAQIRTRLAGEQGRRDYTIQEEAHEVKTETVSGDDDDRLSESFFKLTIEPKNGIYAPPAKQVPKGREATRRQARPTPPTIGGLGILSRMPAPRSLS